MKMYEMKIMNEAQIAELDKLIDAGHGDAINAFASEIHNATMEGFTRGFCNTLAKGCIKSFMTGAVAGVGILVLGHAAVAIGEKVYHKIKGEKSEEESYIIVEDEDV